MSIACAFHSSSADDTAAFAAEIAPALRPRDILFLNGPVGSGKTHFARSIIQTRLKAANRLEDVPSPTFTLVQTYDDGHSEFWHADLYRLKDPHDVLELGLDEGFENAIALVEWPDRLGPFTPARHLSLHFSQGERANARDIEITSQGQDWSHVQSALAGVYGLVCQ